MSLLLLFGGGPAPAGNTAPSVYAGTDGNSTTGTGYGLGGVVTDDGLPSASLTSTWSQVSGPASAVFNDINLPTSIVTFPTAGTYVLRLTGDDSALTATDDLTITVTDPPGNADGMDAPWVRTNWR